MKKRHFSKRQKEIKDKAKERIVYLIEEAGKVFNKNPALADRYVSLARKYSARYKVRIQRELKRRFCKHCYKYLAPGKTCRVRTHKGKVVYFCFGCKKFMRFVY